MPNMLFSFSEFLALGLTQPSLPPPRSTTTTEMLSSVRRCSPTCMHAWIYYIYPAARADEGEVDAS